MDRLSPLIFAAAAIVSPAYAAPLDQFQAHIIGASQRFGIPARWIEAAIKAESNGDARAISPKGAMGLMQLMPETWAGLRDRHDLGADPFDPHTNILAGTAYLKVMQDRFGYPALFSRLQCRTGPLRGPFASRKTASHRNPRLCRAHHGDARRRGRSRYGWNDFPAVRDAESRSNRLRAAALFLALADEKRGRK